MEDILKRIVIYQGFPKYGRDWTNKKTDWKKELVAIKITNF